MIFGFVQVGKTPPDESAVNLILDPGLAFGTGTHPTTALCLEWLAKTKLKNFTFIDYGCGSGILAIAAILLEPRKQYALIMILKQFSRRKKI